MEETLKKRGTATISNFTVNKNIVTLKVKFRQDEMLTSIGLLQTLHADVTILAKRDSNKAVNLGLYVVNSVGFDKDGNCVVVFKSFLDSINPENVCAVLGEPRLLIQFMAVVEIEDKEGEED